MPDTIHKGSCACGQALRGEGRPLSRRRPCHRLICRRLRGAPFNFYMVFPRDAVRTSGEVSVFHSSEHGRRYACASCQTPVYSHYDHADETDLYPGAFDEPGAFPPTCELWTSRREPWLPEFPSVIHRYPKNRKWRRTEGD